MINMSIVITTRSCYAMEGNWKKTSIKKYLIFGIDKKNYQNLNKVDEENSKDPWIKDFLTQ